MLVVLKGRRPAWLLHLKRNEWVVVRLSAKSRLLLGDNENFEFQGNSCPVKFLSKS